MANHGYGHIRNYLDVEQLTNDLLEINKNRFNNLFTITHDGDNREEIWLVELENSDIDFQIWFNKKAKIKKLEYPHDHCGDAGWWFQETFVSLLISKYNGMISDDGCEGKWKPEFHIKYPHMIDWFMRDLSWIKGSIKRAFFTRLYKDRYKKELKFLPDSIKEVI